MSRDPKFGVPEFPPTPGCASTSDARKRAAEVVAPVADVGALAIKMCPNASGPCPHCLSAIAAHDRALLERAWDEGHRLTVPHSDRCEPTCPNPYRAIRSTP